MNRLPLFAYFLLPTLLLPVCLSPTPVRAQTAPTAKRWVESKVTKRVALVIGNAAYQNGSKLTNPVNDAIAMAKVLKSLGFEVITVTDGTKRQMLDAIDTFGNKLTEDCVALCFYSGHGMQISGTNYLLPVDFAGKARADVEFEAVAAERILGRFDEKKSPVNVLILDACRNNPFRSFSRGTERGLTRMDAPHGTLIAYATAPGDVADDNAGGANGLYTQELLKRLPAPGVKVQDVFQSVLEDVSEASGGKQRPWVESSLVGRLYLAKGDVPPTPVGETKTAVATDTKARLVVTPNVPGATVSVDGKVAVKGNFAINLLDETEKSVTVKVTAPDYEGQLIPITVIRGKTVNLPVVLEASVNTPTVKRVTLAYRAKQGRKRRSKTQASLQMEGLDAVMGIENVGTLTFAKIKPNGEITIAEQVESQEYTLNGQPFQQPETDTGSSSVTITNTGEIVSSSEDDPQENDYFAIRMQAASIVIYPAKPVGEGDKWSHDYVANKKLGTRAAHADFTLVGFEDVGGVEAARIKMQYKEVGAGGSITANNTILIELSSGDVLRRDMTASGMTLGPNGEKARGTFHEEKVSGGAL